MKLDYISLHNAFSHKDSLIRLSNNGLCLINGSNGAGKSSVVKGLLFAFFSIGTDDVVNNKIGKNTYVGVTGSVGDDEFAVRRYRKDTEHKNNLYFYINGKEVAGATNTALQTKLESFIGCDYRSFTTIAAFSNDMLMFAASTDTERKAIFEKILQDLEIYTDYHRIAKEEVAILSVDIASLEQDVEGDERELEVVQSVLETEESRALVLEERRKEDLAELEEERHELDVRLRTSIRLKAKRERYNSVVFRLEHWLDSYLNPSEEIEDADTGLYMLDQKEGDLAFNDCPVCSTELTPSLRNEEMEKIRIRRKEINKELKKLEGFQELRRKVTSRMNDYLDRVHALEYKLVKYEDTPDKMKKLDEKIDKAKGMLDDKDVALDMWAGKIRTLAKRIAAASRKMKKWNVELQYLKEVTQGFSKQGIPNIIITRALSMLERCANSYLDTLTSGAMSLKLSGMTKTKKGAIRNKIGIDVVSESGVTSFDSYSGGERQRFNIALLLALRDVAEHNKGIKLNCLFLDEVLDLSLDEEGIEEVLQLLRHKKSSVDSIFVITPKTQLVNNTGVTFDTVMEVTKLKGFSNIEVKESL